MVTMELIKELRTRTSAGISDCKKALEETKGDIENAIKWLREKGIAKAAKKAGAIAAEGSAIAFAHNDRAIILELNSQTDFVAKNPEFISFVQNVGNTIVNSNVTTLDEALKLKLHTNKAIHEETLEMTGRIGEKIDLRRVMFVHKNSHDSFGIYNHFDNRVAVIIVAEGKGHEDLAKGIAMHAAAMRPQFISKDEISAEKYAAEKAIVTEQIMQDEKNKSKPANIVEKMIEGRLSKELAETCLNDQAFIKEPGKKISQVCEEHKTKIKTYVRFEVGEGIEKVTTDFAAEVAAQMASAHKK